MPLQVFRHQPPMTPVRLVFTAKQVRAIHLGWREGVLDGSFLHQPGETPLIAGPAPTLLSVLVQQRLGRGQLDGVAVGDTKNAAEEGPEVIRFGEPASWERLLRRMSTRLLGLAISSK
jgi:hypothetical protein